MGKDRPSFTGVNMLAKGHASSLFLPGHRPVPAVLMQRTKAPGLGVSRRTCRGLSVWAWAAAPIAQFLRAFVLVVVSLLPLDHRSWGPWGPSRTESWVPGRGGTDALAPSVGFGSCGSKRWGLHPSGFSGLSQVHHPMPGSDGAVGEEKAGGLPERADIYGDSEPGPKEK